MTSEPRELIRTVNIKITKDVNEIIQAYELIHSSVSSQDELSKDWQPYFEQDKLCHPAAFYAAHPNVGVAIMSFGEYSLARCLVYRADSKTNWTHFSNPYGHSWMILGHAMYDAGMLPTKDNSWKTTEQFFIPGKAVLWGKKKKEDFALFYPFFDTLAEIKITFDQVTHTFKFYPMTTPEAVTGPYAKLKGGTHRGFLLASDLLRIISAADKQEKLKAS